MQQTQYIKDRYPGLRSFEKNQNAIFFGREAETNELFNLVSLEKKVVFFGKSGLGKSSLLNAGLSPLLEENGFLPIRIRFSPGNRADNSKGDDANLLLRDCIVAFGGYDHKEDIQFEKGHPQLWEHVKCTPFTDKNGTPVVPVFIFDQFEEFFYHPVHHQQEFMRQLSEIIHDQPPRRILEWITGIPAASRTPEQLQWYRQTQVKLIFAMRSDKLALMQSVTPYISTILRCRYELKPLNREQAAAAIELPALKAMEDGYTPAFWFNKDTLNAIVNELDQGSNEIESSQLQMVCNYIEQQVRKRQDAEEGIQDIEVDDSIINPRHDIIAIRSNFYEDQLKKIPNEDDRALARRVLEDEMVIEGQRASLLETQLVQELKGKRDLLVLLQQARLIREENTNRGLTYEVSHDTLIAPIEKSKDRRAEAEASIRLQEEKERLEARALADAKENQDNLNRLAEERALRAEAERQKQEADRQRKKVARLSAMLLIAGLLITIFGVWLYNIQQRSKLERQQKELKSQQAKIEQQQQARQSDSLRLVIQDLTNKNLNKADSLVQNVIDQGNRPPASDDFIKNNEEQITAAYEIIKETGNADTSDFRFKQVVNKVYAETRKIRKDLPESPNKTIREKVDYLEKNLPDMKPEQRVKY